MTDQEKAREAKTQRNEKIIICFGIGMMATILLATAFMESPEDRRNREAEQSAKDAGVTTQMLTPLFNKVKDLPEGAYNVVLPGEKGDSYCKILRTNPRDYGTVIKMDCKLRP